ncbi:BAH domain-containing protein, partial [Cephalotus follicularis]
MSHLSEAHEEIKVTFKWGTNTGVGRINKDIHFYNSFIYYDVEYLLYDYVYFYQRDYPEAFIGKLVKIYETPTHEKKVRVVWLFRPSEICNFLGDYEPRWNELFLASGEGKGISNINPLEAVGGKCNVVCMSKDPKNPQPSEAELRNADFIFCCTFDVGSLSIVKNFPDKIDGVKVEHYFNRGKDQKLINGPHLEVNLKEQTGKSSFTSQLGLGKAVRNVVSDGAGRKVSPVVKESKNAADTVVEQRHFPYINTTLRPKVPIGKDETRPDKISCNPNETNAKKVTLPEGLLTRSQLDIEPPKKRMSPPDDKETNTSCKKVLHSARCRDIKTRSQLEEVIRRPATV